MGGAACPLHDAGNDRSIERGSDLQAARRGSLTTPATPAGERESDAALTPRPGTRSAPRSHMSSLDADRVGATKLPRHRLAGVGLSPTSPIRPSIAQFSQGK